VPQVGIINPSEFEPINSIEIVIWVAVGGRGTLYGATSRQNTRKRQKIRPNISDEYMEQLNNELALINSLTIQPEQAERIDAIVENSFSASLYSVPIFAFIIIENRVCQIDLMDIFESSLISLGQKKEITKNQLCLDIENYPSCHRIVASILLYLENKKPSPFHYIISRQAIVKRCKPSMNASTWWGQYISHEADGFYYKIRVDWTQTKPMNTINDY
jgi:hypothetical protein